MWVARTAEQEQRAADAPEVDALAADLQRAGDEPVLHEQVLDDPEVERARDVLHVLEPRLEVVVALEVLGVCLLYTSPSPRDRS